MAFDLNLTPIALNRDATNPGYYPILIAFQLNALACPFPSPSSSHPAAIYALPHPKHCPGPGLWTMHANE